MSKYIIAALALLVLVAASVALYYRGNSIRANAEAEQASQALGVAAAEIGLARLELLSYKAQTVKLNETLARRDKEYEHAKQASDDVIAGLRAGTVQLRQHWRGCEAQLPGEATSAGTADEGTRLREEGAGDLVRLADECDADIRALQQAVMVDR